MPKDKYGRRRRGSRSQTPSVTAVFCEGKETEPNFFASYRAARGYGFRTFKIIKGTTKTTPRQVVDRAIVHADQNHPNDLNAAVVDGDHQTTNYPSLASYSKSHNVLLVVSTPCIEAWFLRQFTDAAFPNQSKEVENQLRKSHWADYEKNTQDMARIIARAPFNTLESPDNCIDISELVERIDQKFRR